MYWDLKTDEVIQFRSCYTRLRRDSNEFEFVGKCLMIGIYTFSIMTPDYWLGTNSVTIRKEMKGIPPLYS